MIEQPTALELVDAVIGFIETRAAPQLKDRDVFLARVAVNALLTLRREIDITQTQEAWSDALTQVNRTSFVASQVNGGLLSRLGLE